MASATTPTTFTNESFKETHLPTYSSSQLHPPCYVRKSVMYNN